MARKKSEFLGSFGKAFQVFKALTDEVLNLGGDDEDLRRLESNGDLRRKLAELIVGTTKEAATILKVVVDYGKSLAEMIAAGKYDGYINPDITEKHFPIPKIPAGLPTKVELNLKLVHFNKVMTSDQVLAELKKQGLRPATLPELLAFGAAYPDKQREFPIVALGSVWRGPSGDRSVPGLWGCAGGRGLDLGWFGGDWGGYYRFLVVRESRQ